MMKLAKVILGFTMMTMAGAALAAPKECTVNIQAGDSTNYNTDEIVIPKKTCKSVTLHFEHKGKLPLAAMGHNVVITKKSDFNDVVSDGLKAGEDHDYLPEDDDRVLAHTELLGGGQESTIKIDTKKFKVGGDYMFFCSFPGHPAAMNGKVKVLDK